MRIKFGIGAEQLAAAGRANVVALLEVLVVLASVRALGSFVSEHLVL